MTGYRSPRSEVIECICWDHIQIPYILAAPPVRWWLPVPKLRALVPPSVLDAFFPHRAGVGERGFHDITQSIDCRFQCRSWAQSAHTRTRWRGSSRGDADLTNFFVQIRSFNSHFVQVQITFRSKVIDYMFWLLKWKKNIWVLLQSTLTKLWGKTLKNFQIHIFV